MALAYKIFSALSNTYLGEQLLLIQFLPMYSGTILLVQPLALG